MLLINIAGFAFIALIIWWFWLYTPKTEMSAKAGLVIKVQNGVYEPARFKIAADKATAIYFERIDPSPCAETVIFPDLQISESLALNEKVRVDLPALSAGVYPFHCQMQMYKGVLHVE